MQRTARNQPERRAPLKRLSTTDNEARLAPPRPELRSFNRSVSQKSALEQDGGGGSVFKNPLLKQVASYAGLAPSSPSTDVDPISAKLRDPYFCRSPTSKAVVGLFSPPVERTDSPDQLPAKALLSGHFGRICVGDF